MRPPFKHALKATVVLQKPSSIDDLFAAIEVSADPGEPIRLWEAVARNRRVSS